MRWFYMRQTIRIKDWNRRFKALPRSSERPAMRWRCQENSTLICKEQWNDGSDEKAGLHSNTSRCCIVLRPKQFICFNYEKYTLYKCQNIIEMHIWPVLINNYFDNNPCCIFLAIGLIGLWKFRKNMLHFFGY